MHTAMITWFMPPSIDAPPKHTHPTLSCKSGIQFPICMKPTFDHLIPAVQRRYHAATDGKRMIKPRRLKKNIPLIYLTCYTSHTQTASHIPNKTRFLQIQQCTFSQYYNSAALGTALQGRPYSSPAQAIGFADTPGHSVRMTIYLQRHRNSPWRLAAFYG